jgi:hypothetical protein
MRCCRSSLLLTVVLIVAGMPRGADALQDLSLHYDVYYLALRVITVDVASRLESRAYRTTVDLRVAGLLATFVPWRSRTVVDGAIEGTAFRPTSYRVDSALGARSQVIDLEYDAGGTVRGEVDGVLSEGERDEVPVALRDGTIDPVTASVAVTQRLAATGSCAGTVRVFDGLRRYDLRYDDLGTENLEPSSRDPYRGPARHCRASVEPIAGFLRTGEHAGERASGISTWLAAPLPDATPVAVRIDLEGEHGTLHVHLARATPAAP